MKYQILRDGIQIGECQLDPFPGCAKIGISHGLKIYPQFQGKGYATRAHKERLALAKELGYKVLLATVISSNVPQNHLLRKFRWQEKQTFLNVKSGHLVTLWQKDLDDPYAELYNWEEPDGSIQTQ